MGILYLHQFMEENGLFEDHKLCNTSVIMDGCSPLFEVFYNTKADFKCGGDYDKYYEDTKEYLKMIFAAFKSCNIEPIIVFDGGHDLTDTDVELIRLKTKQEKRITTIPRVLCGKSNKKIPSINLHEIFKNLISEISVSYPSFKQVQCDYGGDKYIAALANRYACPVLSDDSDYYIYQLPNGFIRLPHIDFKVRSDNEKNYLNCKIYKVDSFLNKFNIKESSILPLFAVLALNNYTEFKNFEMFFKQHFGIHNTHLPSYRNNAFKRFEAILTWLRKFKTDDSKDSRVNLKDDMLLTAKNEVLLSLNEINKQAIERTIDYCFKNYDLNDTDGYHMEIILNGIRSRSEKDILKVTKLRYRCGQSLPEKFIVAVHEGKIPSTLLNIISAHRNILPPQIEDFSQSSSYSCSCYIRQVIYSILLIHDSNSREHKKKCLRKNAKKLVSPETPINIFRGVEECDRKKNKMVTKRLAFLAQLDNGMAIPSLTDIYGLKRKDLRAFIAAVLKVDIKFFNNIPGRLQLLFACIMYWISKCSPDPKLVTALLLCIVHFQTKRKAPQVNVNPYGPELFKHFKTCLLHVHQTNVRIVHHYSQLQTCVQASVALNLLTNLPFKTPALHETLCGTLLYNLTIELKKFKRKIECHFFIELLLGKNSKAIKLFHKYEKIFKTKMDNKRK